MMALADRYAQRASTIMAANTLLTETADAVSGDQFIDRCGSCSAPIGLIAPTTESPASAWMCRGCSSVYFARGQERDGKPATGEARQTSYYEVMKAIYVHMEGDSCPILKQDVQRLVKSSAQRRFNGRDYRKQKRLHGAAQVTVLPLAADFRIAAYPARVMTMNLSGGGAALCHAKPVTEPYVAIDFAASGIELLPAILKVTRVRTLPAAYEIAGRFITRILH